MNKIYISDNSVKRIMKLSFDITYGPDYQTFLEKDEYQDFIIHLPRQTSTVITQDGDAEFGIDTNIYRKLGFLLSYDQIEEYQGLTEENTLFNFFGEKYAKKEWFYSALLNQDIDYIKSTLSKTYTTRPYYDHIPHRIIGLHKDQETNIIYSEYHEPNHHKTYIEFITLISPNPIYIIYKIYEDQFIVVSEDKIPNYSTSSILLHRADAFFDMPRNMPYRNKILELKKQLIKDIFKWEKVFADIRDIVNMSPKSTIKLSSVNHSPTFLEGNFKDPNLNKFAEYKAFIGGYGYVGINEDNGQKTNIVGSKKKKYKDGL